MSTLTESIMKNIKKPAWWKEVPMMNTEQLAAFCQKLYDIDNFRGLTDKEREKFSVAKKNYKEKTGKDVPLSYNCPP